jgi:DNA-binding transcriptional LysR family regulator
MPWDERIGRRLKLRDLYFLKTVVRLGSMGKATSELAVSQPAVSKAITDLERVLGVRLLDRSRQGVEPTRYGSALLKWSTALFDDLKHGVEEIDFLADPTVGEVRIGTGEGMPPGLISAVIARLLRQYPGFTFRVIQAATNDLQYDDLRDRKVDLIFGRLVMPIADKDLKPKILFEDQFLPVADVNSKWLKRRRIEPSELVNEPWCVFENHRFLSSIAKAFRAKGLDMPRCTIVTNSVQLSFAMAAAAGVLTVASASRLRLSGNRLGVAPLPVDLVFQAAPTGIVTLKNRTIGPAAQMFIDCARTVAKSFSLAKAR